MILAAGQSSRMRGGDKLLETVDGIPLLRAQIDKAEAISCLVFVALPDPTHPRAAILKGTKATPLFIPKAAEGMGATLRDGVAQLPDCAAFMLLLGDLPALTVDDLRCVLEAQIAHSDCLIWRGATADGKPGHPIIFDAKLREEFAHLYGDTGGEPLVSRLRAQTRLVPLPDDHARLDLDTPEDWASWRKSTGR